MNSVALNVIQLLFRYADLLTTFQSSSATFLSRYRDRIPTGLNSYTVCIPTIPTCSNTVPKPDPIPTGLNYYKSAAYPLLQVPYTGLIQCMAHRQ